MDSDLVMTPYGRLPARHKCAKLAEVCVEERGVQTGPFGSQLHQRDYVSSGTPIVTVEHLGDNRIVHRDLPKVSDEDRERLSRYSLRCGDIVFSRVGSVDLRALVREEEEGWLFSGRCLRVRPKSDVIDSGYLSWFFGLPTFRAYVRNIAFGATMPSLNTKLLSGLPVYFPPLPEQRAIAAILGALDDKIELNHRMNETLEAMAQALFKNWFVDFEPFRDQGIQNSSLGPIPKGWSVKETGDVSERVSMGPFGSSIKVETFVREGVPIISGKHLNRFVMEDNTFNFITHDHAKRLGNAVVERGDVVFTHAGNIGQAAFIPKTSRYERYVISQRQFYMRCDLSQVTPTFIALYFNSPIGRHQLLANTSSSGVPSIARPVTYLRSIQIPVPPKDVLDSFEQLVTPLLLGCANNLDMNRTLAVQRDTLLPKLLSGQIRLKDADKFMERAA